MNVIGARPQHDTFGIDNAMLIHPGDPSRSILYQRLVRQGRGQMPPLCRKVADERAVAVSKVIPENYATTEIESRSGRQISGRIEREDNRTLLMRPLDATEEMVTLRKSDIRRRAFSSVSNMPAGIVNTLTEGQILDLLAYLIADGKPGEENRK